MIGSNGTYNYARKNYWYTCVAKDDKNSIVVKVSVFAFRIIQLSCRYTFNLTLKDLPKSIQKSKAKSTMTKTLDHLKKSGYTPRLNKSNGKLTFQKNTFGSSILNNFLARMIWDLGEVLTYLPRSQSSLDSVMAKAAKRANPRLTYQMSKAPSETEDHLPPKGNLLEHIESIKDTDPVSELELISTDKLPPDDLPPPFPFPVDSLKKILNILEEVKIDELIQDLSDRVENKEETVLTPLLKKLDYDTSKGIGAFFSANLSVSGWKNLLGAAYSQVGILDALHLFRGNFKKGGKVGEALLAKDDLMNYLSHFSPLPEQTLNIKDLLFDLLRDESLKDFLKNEDVQNHLSHLIASLNIPKFDAENAKKTIKIFVKFQEIVPKLIRKQNSLNSCDAIYGYLSTHVLGGVKDCKPEEVIDFAQLGCDLISIIDVFMAPSPMPIQYLLSSTKDKTISCFVNEERKIFFDCKDLFENYQDDKSLGIYLPFLITAKIQTLINEKNLSGYSFIDSKENITRYEESKSNLFVNFDGCIFDGFSFENTHFINFHFKDVYFKNCNFTNVSFARNIIFENIYMDMATAENFMKGLDDSYHNVHYQLKLTGIETVILLGEGNLKLSPKFRDYIEKIASSKSFSAEKQPVIVEEASTELPTQEEVPSWSSSFTSALNAAYGLASATTNTILHPIETAQNIGGIGLGIASGIASPILHPIETAANIKEQVGSLFTYYTSSYNIGKNVLEDYKQSNKIKTKFTSVKDEIESEIEKLKKELKLITNSASSEYREMNEKVIQHEEALKVINTCIAELNKKHLEIKQIHLEQKELLNGPLKSYYQTLLTGLCTVFNSISLLNNEYVNLIQPIPGKANYLSNRGSKSKVADEKPLKYVERKLRNGLDHLLEPSELFIPILENIPKIPGVVSGLIKSIAEINNQAKLNKTQKIFRGLTPKKLEEFSDEIARMISFCYREQILLLPEASIIRFAESGVECIASALLNGQIPEEEDLILYAFKSLRQLKQNNHRNVMNINIPFTQESLKGLAPKVSYKADDLYRKSGIQYLEEGKWYIYHQSDLSPEQFGYIRIKDKQYKEHFINANHPQNSPDKVSPLGASNQDHISLLIEEKFREFTLEYAQIKIKQAELDEMKIRLEEINKVMTELYQKKSRGENVTINEIKTPPKPAKAPSKVSLSCPQGFINLGQSCYMNAALQVIRKVPIITERIQEITSSGEAEDKNNALAKAISEVLIDSKEENLENLRDAIFDLSVFKNEGFTNYKEESKRTYEIKQTKTPYIEPTYDYYKSSQIDVQEVLGAIFNHLKLIPFEVEECASAPGITEITEIIDTSPENICRVIIPSTMDFLKYLKNKHRTKEALDAFLKKKYKANEFEQYLENKNNPDKIPPIPMTFQDILDVHFFGEEMDTPRVIGNTKVDKWTKSPKVVGQPDYVMFQIVRFNSQGDKIQTPLDFLNSGAKIECSTGKEEYEIVTYVNHNGTNLHSGHYVSYVKNETDGEWYFYDDAEVKKQKPNQKLNYVYKTYNTSKDGYLVVLKKAL